VNSNLLKGGDLFSLCNHLQNQNQNVLYSDLYSITSHKWACGPEGLGAIYVSDKFIHETDPTIIGWKSLKKEQGIYEPSDNLFHDDARKFEVATSCIPLLAGLRNSLDLLDKDCHEKEKNENIKKLSGKLWDELNQLNEVELVLEKKYLNGIVSFNIENIVLDLSTISVLAPSRPLITSIKVLLIGKRSPTELILLCPDCCELKRLNPREAGIINIFTIKKFKETT